MLGDLDYKLCETALMELFATHTYPPQISEIREKCAEYTVPHLKDQGEACGSRGQRYESHGASGSDKGGLNMIEIISVKDIKDATPEELANLRRKGLLPAEETRRISGRPLSSYERTRAQVAATGNRWAMENFIATHS